MKRFPIFLLAAFFALSVLQDGLFGQKRIPDVDADGVTTQGGGARYELSSSTLQINEIDEFVENLRSIAGGGRNIERTPDGKLQAAYTEGTTGSYGAYWAGSDDDGMSWVYGNELGTGGRYATLDMNQNGTYVAFHEDIVFNVGYVYRNPDPFSNPDNFTSSGPLTPLMEEFYVSVLDASAQGSRVLYGWYDFTNLVARAGLSADGVNFQVTSILYQDPGFEAGPTVIVEGSYVLAVLLTADMAVAPTDTSILNHTTNTGGFWHGFMESTDGGETWSAIAPMFGLNIGDFPRVPAENEDLNIVGEAAAAGGTNWINLTKPVLYNNQVFVVTVNESVTLNDGVFPTGFWDGLSVPLASVKTAGHSGVWSHETVGRTLRYSGGEYVSGDGWYGEISTLSGGNNLAVTYVDRSIDVPQVVVVASNDGGSTWNFSKSFDGQADFGFLENDFDIFISASSSIYLDPGGEAWIDLAFLGDVGGVINSTLYHTMLPIDDLIIPITDSTVVFFLSDDAGAPGQTATIELGLANLIDVSAVEFGLSASAEGQIGLDSAYTVNRGAGMELTYNPDSLRFVIYSPGQAAIGSGFGEPVAVFTFAVDSSANVENVHLTMENVLCTANNNVLVQTIASDTGTISIQLTDVTDRSSIPVGYELFQNFPNPFNPRTTIKYELAEDSKVVLRIYNALGQEVRTLVQQPMKSGYHSTIWDGRNNANKAVSSGLYIYRLEAGEFYKCRKMMFLK